MGGDRDSNRDKRRGGHIPWALVICIPLGGALAGAAMADGGGALDGFVDAPYARMIATGLVAMNLMAFGAFAIDKRLAQSGGWRISEFTLLALAFFGGTIGAYAGRSLFRHKTRKEPFGTQLFSVAMVQVVVIGLLAWGRYNGV